MPPPAVLRPRRGGSLTEAVTADLLARVERAVRVGSEVDIQRYAA